MRREDCPNCDGEGWIFLTDRNGDTVEATECPVCFGRGAEPVYNLNQFSADARAISRTNGFEGPSDISDHLQVSQKLMLIVSECAEAMEEVRKTQDIEAFGEELVDILIRVVDLGYDMGIDFDAITERKMAKNRERGFRHGNRAF